MPLFSLSLGGGGGFVCTHQCTHSEAHKCVPSPSCTWNGVHTSKCVHAQKQPLKVVKLLVKIFYLATVITTTMSGGIAITKNLKYNNGISTTTNVKYNNIVFCLQHHPVKYDNIIFCLQKHPANSIMWLSNKINTFYVVNILNSVSASNQSLKAIAECGDDIQDLGDLKTLVNNITNSPTIVQCKYKDSELASSRSLRL